MHSVGTGDTQAAELDTASESHAAVVEDDKRTPDLEVNTGAVGLSAGEGTDESHAWNVVAHRHCKNVLRTSQQKSTQVQAVQPKNSQRKSKLFGTRQSENSRIKAGIDIVRKSVVHIDNLDVDCTAIINAIFLLVCMTFVPKNTASRLR